MTIETTSPISLFFGYAWNNPRIGTPISMKHPKPEDKVTLSPEAIKLSKLN